MLRQRLRTVEVPDARWALVLDCDTPDAAAEAVREGPPAVPSSTTVAPVPAGRLAETEPAAAPPTEKALCTLPVMRFPAALRLRGCGSPGQAERGEDSMSTTVPPAPRSLAHGPENYDAPGCRTRAIPAVLAGRREERLVGGQTLVLPTQTR
jgi:hypothetical protein